MADNNKKGYSDDELDKILKEYSGAGRQRDYARSAQNGNISQSKNNIYMNSNNPNLNPNVKKDASIPNRSAESAEKKKFVVHIDESIIDSAPQTDNSHHNGNTGGIYFSNYSRGQKNNGLHQSFNPNSDRASTPKSADKSANKPIVRIDNKRNSSRAAAVVSNTKASVKKKVETIGVKTAAAFLAFIIISTSILSYIGLTCVGDMLAINRSEENVEVQIPPNSSLDDILTIFKKNKLIKRKAFCTVFTAFRGFDDEQYLSGNYYLNSKMGVEGMLKDLMAAPVTADTITLSFPEGWTIQQIFEKLEKYDVCDSSKLYSAAKSSSYDASYKFMADITNTDDRYLKLEGYMFPDTYDFYVDADTNYVIKKFLDNFDSKWEDEYNARAEKLGYTRDEIITIASIIQKEAADSEQMKVISSILHNRLKDQANYPTLGCDSTAIYISNYVTPIIGEAQGKLLYDNYDTSAIRGLPPGPICNPGIDAIRAALYPEETDYYFFAHDKSGKIYLSKTLSEHRNNLVKIIQANNK